MAGETNASVGQTKGAQAKPSFGVSDFPAAEWVRFHRGKKGVIGHYIPPELRKLGASSGRR